MARKRMIDPSIWINEDFGMLSNLAKLVFIGLFSIADDEGRGKASPAYIKAVLFPYNDDLRIADIEKTLLEISSKMSVIFYSCDENKYYTLINWDRWQKIDKPTSSQIPAFDKENKEIRLLFDEFSTNSLRGLSTNRIEKNKTKNKRKEKEFIAPTLEEVEKYVVEKKLSVNAKKFYDYFTEGNWIDSKGNPVKSWKQKILTWNGYGNKEMPKESSKKTFQSYEQRNYSDLDKIIEMKQGG